MEQIENLVMKTELSEKRSSQENSETRNSRTSDYAHQQIVGYLQNEKLNHFNTISTPSERVQFIFKNEAFKPLLEGILGKSSGYENKAGSEEKSAKNSKQMREAGNSAFAEGDDKIAMQCYNQALLSAPADTWNGHGEEMALAFANRSALFMRQGKVRECIKDSTMALSSGYPDHLRYKIFQRQATCLSKLGMLKEAKQYYKDAVASLDFTKLNNEQKKVLQVDIFTKIDILERKEEGTQEEDSTNITADEIESNKTEVYLQFKRNPNFPSFEESITIKYDITRGRYGIANGNIKCGSYIAYEEPVVSYLWSDKLMTHCTSCFCPVETLIPCFQCSRVVFCSSECRIKAWNTFHQHECKILDAVTSTYQNIFIAYRTIAQKPLNFFIENRSKFDNYNYDPSRAAEEYKTQGENKKDASPYVSSDYENLYNLLTHSDKASDADQLNYASCACLLLHFLRLNNFFGSNVSKERNADLSENEVLIGSLLYHVLEVIQFNTHAVNYPETWEPEPGLTTSFIGCALNPSFALFNHSCTPNTARVNIGQNTLMIAAQDIQAGDEISDGYSYQYCDQAYDLRQGWLRDHYKFDCGCAACEGKWPLHGDITNALVKPGRSNKDLQNIENKFLTIKKLTSAELSAGNFDRVRAIWSEFYTELEQVLEKPHNHFVYIYFSLQDALWLQLGNMRLHSREDQ